MNHSCRCAVVFRFGDLPVDCVALDVSVFARWFSFASNASSSSKKNNEPEDILIE